MNSTITEMKNTLEGINNRITEVEEQINDVEDRMVEFTAVEQNKEKRMKRTEDSLICPLFIFSSFSLYLYPDLSFLSSHEGTVFFSVWFFFIFSKSLLKTSHSVHPIFS